MPKRKRVAVLISGRGSNLGALIAACRDKAFPAEIALVLSNRPEAGGLAVARQAGIPAAIVDHEAHVTKARFEAALEKALADADIDIVCLAGFMRVLSPRFVEAWRDRLLNIHPSLLPAFPGLGTHARALAAGVKIHGATVHFVRAEVDHGPIVGQAAVPVVSEDTPESLAARVLAVEHRLYPLALELVASGRAPVTGQTVVLNDARCDPGAALLSPPG